MFVAGEITQVIPTHRVDIRLPNLFPEDRVVSSQETVQLLVTNKRLLLNDLSIDVG